MDTKKFRFVNKTRDNALSQAVTLVDSTFEPLTVLRVMVEGLAHNEATGLWLTRVSDLPAVPRLAPFDVIYLNKDQQVVEACELLPAARLPVFRKPSVSALVLPFQTISSSKTAAGDELEFTLVDPQTAAEAPIVNVPQSAPLSVSLRDAVPAISAREAPAVEPVAPAIASPAAIEHLEEIPTPQEDPAEPALPPQVVAEAQPEIVAPLAIKEAAPELPVVSLAPAEPLVEAVTDAPESAKEGSAPEVAQPVQQAEPAFPAITSSEIELTNALNRALASAEKEFETSDRFKYLESDAEEIDAEPTFSSSRLDAAELLRSSRSRKRRPSRLASAGTRKSRAGLRRAEADKPVFIHKSELDAPESPEAAQEQHPQAALDTAATPLSLESTVTEIESAVPEIAPSEPVAATPITPQAQPEPVAAMPDLPSAQPEVEVTLPVPEAAAAEVLSPELLVAASASGASDFVTEPIANAASAASADWEPVAQLDSSPVNDVPLDPALVDAEDVAPVSAPPQIPVAAPSPIGIPGAALPQYPGRPGQHFEDEDRSAEPVIGRFLRWLYPAVYQEERRSSVRWPAPDLVAYQIRGESLRKLEVRNISSSGIYVLTHERWKPGEVIQLSLQKNGLPEQRIEHRVEIEAGAARYGKDGVGLTFALPAGTNLDLWDRAIQGNANESGADYIIKEIRLARALGCLRRICAPALHHAQVMLHKEFSNVRVANAIKIVLKAENLLNQEIGGDRFIAHPETVVRILELGSWVDTDWIEDLWAGLLATSCTIDGQDYTNLPFVEMLSQFAPIHLRVLGMVSAKARHEGVGLELAEPEYVTAGELARALDVSNITKILRTISELSEYGLLTKAIRSPSSPHDSSAQTAVTRLGLEMFARCHGLRETIAPAAWHGISTVIVSPAYTEAAGFMEVRRS